MANSKAEEETLPHCPEPLSPVVVLSPAAALYIQKLTDSELKQTGLVLNLQSSTCSCFQNNRIKGMSSHVALEANLKSNYSQSISSMCCKLIHTEKFRRMVKAHFHDNH